MNIAEKEKKVEISEENSSKKENFEVAPLTKEEELIKKSHELADAVADSQTKEELDSNLDAFKINKIKEDTYRVNKLSKLLDLATNQAIERIAKRPDELSDKDLMGYMNATQNIISRRTETLDEAKDIKAVQINNDNRNITVQIGGGDPIARESREKVLDVLNSILNEGKIIDVEVKDEQETDTGNNSVNNEETEKGQGE